MDEQLKIFAPSVDRGGVKDDIQMENLFSLAISYDPFELEKDGLRAGCDCEKGGFHCDLSRVFLH